MRMGSAYLASCLALLPSLALANSPPPGPVTIANGGGSGGAGGAGGAGGMGGAGGAGGNASQHQSQQAIGRAAAAAHSNTVNNVTGNGNSTTAPSMSTAVVSGSACAVGAGVGGAGQPGGGLLVATWLSDRCMAQIEAQILWGWGMHPQAIDVLRHGSQEVDAAFTAHPELAGSGQIAGTPLPASDHAGLDVLAAQCSRYTPAQRARYPECHGS